MMRDTLERRTARWLFTSVGVLALGGLVFAAIGAGAALHADTWGANRDLAMLELTVIGALVVASLATFARGRRTLRVAAWASPIGARRWLERAALLWCAAVAALLGVFPGLAMDLGQPAVWPVVLIAVSTFLFAFAGTEPPAAVAWLLCTTYGLAASASLLVVRHVL